MYLYGYRCYDQWSTDSTCSTNSDINRSDDMCEPDRDDHSNCTTGSRISYSIDGIDYTNTTGTFTGVAPGTYNVTVQNAAGCISTATQVTIAGAPTAPAAPTLTTTDPTTCTDVTGTITVTTPAPAAGI